MSTKNKQEITAEDIFNGLADILNKKTKRKAKKANYILVINGEIPSNMVTMKQAEAAVKRLATVDVTVEVFSSLGKLSTDLKVALTLTKKKGK